MNPRCAWLMTNRTGRATKSRWTCIRMCSLTAFSSCPRISNRARRGPSSSASTGWKAGRRTSSTRRPERPITIRLVLSWPIAATLSMRRRIRISARTASGCSSERPILSGCRYFLSSSASMNGRSIGSPSCRSSIRLVSRSTAYRMAARQRCACQPSCRAIAFRFVRVTSTNGSGRTSPGFQG